MSNSQKVKVLILNISFHHRTVVHNMRKISWTIYAFLIRKLQM